MRVRTQSLLTPKRAPVSDLMIAAGSSLANRWGFINRSLVSGYIRSQGLIKLITMHLRREKRPP